MFFSCLACHVSAKQVVDYASTCQQPNGNADAMPEKGALNNVRTAPTASEDLTEELTCVGRAQTVTSQNQTPNSESSSTPSNPAIKLATEECAAEVGRVLKCDTKFTLD
jgi:hypothetical protein